MSVNFLKDIKVLIFNENGRLLYQFDPATCQQQLDTNVDTNHNITSISECVFGSVSIQSPPDVCITRIHQLNRHSLMTSVVFDIKTTSPTTNTTTGTINNVDHLQQQQQCRSQKDLNHSIKVNHNQNNSSHRQQASNNHRTSSSTTISNDSRNIVNNTNTAIRKKLGLALIWNRPSLNENQQSSHNMTDFVLNHIKAIDMYLDQLKNNIVNSSSALKSKIIHEHVRTCLSSINSYANSLIVSNISSFNRNDYIEEFMSILDELDNRGLHSILVGILSVLYSIGDYNRLQIILTSTFIEKKSLILRILFLVYCFYFDLNLNDSLWSARRHNARHQYEYCLQNNKASKISSHQLYQQQEALDAGGFTVLTLNSANSNLPPSHLIDRETNTVTKSKHLLSDSQTELLNNHYPSNNNINNNNDGDDSFSATCEMFEVVQAPRIFSIIPAYKMQVLANNSRLICEPIITNSYLLPASLQCIITSQLDLVHQQLLNGSQNFTILRVNCDSWGLKLISQGEVKPVYQSLAINELILILRQLRKLRIDPTMLLDLFYCKLKEFSQANTSCPKSSNDYITTL